MTAKRGSDTLWVFDKVPSTILNLDFFSRKYFGANSFITLRHWASGRNISLTRFNQTGVLESQGYFSVYMAAVHGGEDAFRVF